MDALLAKHRKEQRDLVAQLTQKKKSATKKTRKGVNDECARLEGELKQRQADEVAQLEGTTDIEEVGGHVDALEGAPRENGHEADNITAGLAATTIVAESNGVEAAVDEQQQQHSTQQQPPKKPNRQKARLAKRAAEHEQAAAQAAEEAASMPDLRRREREALAAAFAAQGLVERPVAANGHCLYSAVADQLRQLGVALDGVRNGGGEGQEMAELRPDDYKHVRAAAADYMAGNPADFEPFLEEPLAAYTHKVRDTAEWGGQLELLALARRYGVRIRVVQSEGRVEEIDGSDRRAAGRDAGRTNDVWLAYYRHGFGLGEHYNSLRQVTLAPAAKTAQDSEA